MALRSEASTPLTTVTLTNNSGLAIRNLYLSAADNNNWGANQLGGTVINPGGVYTLNVSWDRPTVKLIAEDEDGCFLTTTVDATANTTWNITGESSRDCGG
jgi:hypothetical protein